jgi:hypothetical protein
MNTKSLKNVDGESQRKIRNIDYGNKCNILEKKENEQK